MLYNYLIIFAILIVTFLVYQVWFTECKTLQNPANSTEMRPGCKGEDCSCKKGNPCIGKLALLRKQVHENRDETYFCPHCDKKSFTLPHGDPYSLAQEYKCGCGHWGWLHY
jgi:hypothetical protein